MFAFGWLNYSGRLGTLTGWECHAVIELAFLTPWKGERKHVFLVARNGKAILGKIQDAKGAQFSSGGLAGWAGIGPVKSQRFLVLVIHFLCSATCKIRCSVGGAHASSNIHWPRKNKLAKLVRDGQEKTRTWIATSNKCIATSNKCLTSSNKKLLVTRSIATSNKCLTSSNKKLLLTRSIATSNKCLTSSNKKILVTSASLLVTSALLVVTRSYY